MKPDQLVAAEHLGCGKSNRQAATAADVSEGTIRNWMRLPDFQAAVLDARKDYQGQVERKLSGYAMRAAETVGKAGAMLLEPSAPQLAAAKLTLQAIGVAGDKLAVDLAGKVQVEVATVEQMEARNAQIQAEIEEIEAELFPGGYDEAAVRMWLRSRGMTFPDGVPGDAGLSLRHCTREARREMAAGLDA